ncbi:MAG: hypothetical protein LRZ85_07735 [Alphaproteobacteria bacterium]|nr:hypothetical protein [Alphaproteobacteria bacterium]MCD8570432.1 hypothetical protein [Alphaproteobacteria bacterium]
MIKYLLILAFITGGFLGLPEAAYADSWACPTKAPEIKLSRVLGKTRLYRTKDINTLTHMHTDGAANRQGMYVNGLGGGKIGLEGQASFTVMQRGDQACIWLKGIDAKFFALPTIHIANNFPKGTCEYDAVMEHEKKHIRVLQDFHKEFAPKFKTALRRIASDIPAQGPFDAKSTERIQQDMNARINTGIQSFNDNIIPILEARQAQVDNPNEYARVEAQCKNWNKYVQ